MSFDRTKGDTFTFRFTSRTFAAGVPTALAGSPVLSAMEDAVDTPITTGVTLTASSVAGLNLCTIDSSQADFESGKEYDVYLSAGTVGGVSVVGEVVGHFSLGRGAAAVDLANGTDGLGAIKADTAEIGTAGAGLTNINLPDQTMAITGNITGDLSGSVGSVTGAVGSVTGHTNQTGDNFAIVNGSAGLVAIDTVVDAIKVVTDKITFTVANQVDANVLGLSGSTTAADNLEASTLGIVATTVNDAGASTTAFIITSSEATDDHFNGRIITFTSGALAGQATDITDYTGATKTVTVTALTEAPANGVSLVIT